MVIWLWFVTICWSAIYSIGCYCVVVVLICCCCGVMAIDWAIGYRAVLLCGAGD